VDDEERLTMTMPTTGDWLNKHCDQCGRTNPNPPSDYGVALVPDDWRVISGPMLGSTELESEQWMTRCNIPAFTDRGMTFDHAMSRWVLCPDCLPPMNELSWEDQRCLFSPAFGVRWRAEPWGPVHDGVPLPCPAERTNRHGDRWQCERVQGHEGPHLAGQRYFDDDREGP
jgi:hypothetical protein